MRKVDENNIDKNKSLYKTLLKYADEEYNWEKVLGYVVLKYTKNNFKTSNNDITSQTIFCQV
tara:strand:+ start:643 stop:828 length:186 start_codon:yes stop_codon:yes gene_type:complete